VHALVGVVQKIIVDKNQITSVGFIILLISLIPVHSISQPVIAETTVGHQMQKIILIKQIATGMDFFRSSLAFLKLHVD